MGTAGRDKTHLIAKVPLIFNYPVPYATALFRNLKKIVHQTGLKGFEPLTYRLRVCRSTELSYKPAN
jgi:hypothetical protein